MTYSVFWGNHAKKFVKKIKEKPLKRMIVDAVYNEIAKTPYKFHAKVGNLSGFYTYNFKYRGSDYRIAYTINEKNEIVIIVLAGSHENFYEQLKRLAK